MALDRHPPADIAAEARRGGHRAGAPVARHRRRLHEAPAGRRARGHRRAARGPAEDRADRGRRDGAEDVRAGGRRGRRRLPQLDDAREGAVGARARARGRARRPAASSRRPCSGTCVSRWATTPRSGCARRSRSTGSCTRATSATSRRSARRRERSASPRATRPRSRRGWTEYDGIDHIVVRALAHADAESLGKVAEAAAPRLTPRRVSENRRAVRGHTSRHTK